MSTQQVPIADRNLRHRAILAALRIRFPGTRFYVRGSRGTGYGWSTVRWTDGPSRPLVDAIVDGFFGSSFNGMTDGYDSTHNYFTFEGVTYAAGGSGYHLERSISPAFARRLLAAVATRYNVPKAEQPKVGDRTDWRGRPDWFLARADGTPLPLESTPMADNSSGLATAYYWSYQGIMGRASDDRTQLEPVEA